MKYTIVLFVIALILATSKAKAEAVPEYMRDGVIKVTLKDGKTYDFSLNDWKVVPRLGELAPQEATPQLAKKPAEEREERKNRITLHGGIGYDGLKVTNLGPGAYRVDPAQRFVYGATYARKISNRWSLSATALSNETYTLGVGFDF